MLVKCWPNSKSTQIGPKSLEFGRSWPTAGQSWPTSATDWQYRTYRAEKLARQATNPFSHLGVARGAVRNGVSDPQVSKTQAWAHGRLRLESPEPCATTEALAHVWAHWRETPGSDGHVPDN